jgi:hypothetical protein
MEPSNETIKIYVWPDNHWASEDDIDDMDWYLSSNGRSDDYAIYYVPIELEYEDIEELIELQALPGMIPDEKEFDIIEEGKVKIPDNCIVIIHHSKDIDYDAAFTLKDRVIINAPNMIMEVIKGK